MTHIKRYITYIATLCLLLTAGCSDDFGGQKVFDDGMCHLTLSLPTIDYKRATRSDDTQRDPENTDAIKESYINNLFLLAYDVNGVNSKIEKINQQAFTLTSTYKDFDVTLVPGNYRVYLVANVSEIESLNTNNTLDNLSEQEFLRMVMRYSSEIIPAPSGAQGLPMLGILDSEKNGEVYEAQPGAATATADMVFLCSKVRYTLLFDNTESDGSSDAGFSNAAFGDKTLDITGVRADNVADRAYIAEDGVYNAMNLQDVEGFGEREALSIEYFSIGSENLTQGKYCSYPEDISAPESLTPLAEGTLPDHNKRAYQGTLYLPENLNSESLTTLFFSAECDGTELEYEVELPTPAGTQEVSGAPYVSGTLQRGHFYDLIGRIKGFGGKLDVTLSVKDWSIENLVYDLQVPYFLHVQETTVEVQAGEKTVMWYDSDAKSLELVSPKYNDGSRDLDLYVMDKETYPDSLIISVNPLITANIDINADDAEHNYFYLKAGNLYKRIAVTPLSLAPFLNVTPGIVTFDVREMIGSGLYDKEQPIKIETNLPNVKVERVDGSSWVEASDLINIATGNQEISEGIKELPLNATGINQGLDFWKKESTLQLRFTALNTDGTIAKDKDGNQLIEIVTVKTYPNNLDYKIHFYGKGWTHPHIYVYQCLDLPNDAVATINGVQIPVGGMTVGTESDPKAGYQSALQYSFTGKISFKGWDYSEAQDNYNNPNGVGYKDKGFFFFSNNYLEWYPGNDNAWKHYYLDRDFCLDHRNKLITIDGACPDCYDSDNYARFWPGIQMIPGKKIVEESNDYWWDFDLTGIASPGRALIMFNDGHVDNKIRYPGDLEVGIPLFDYPSREGWFMYQYNDNQFMPKAPIFKYRLYWPDNLNSYTGMNLWYQGGGAIYNQGKNTTPPLGYQNGWWYFDFSTVDYTAINVMGIWNIGKDIMYHQNYNQINLNDFIESDNINGIRCYTIKDFNQGVPGAPSASPSITSSILNKDCPIRIKWPIAKPNASSIHIWEVSNQNTIVHTDWATQANIGTDGGYRYFDFNLEQDDVKVIGYILHDPNQSGSNMYLSDGELKNNYDTSINRYVYTID